MPVEEQNNEPIINLTWPTFDSVYLSLVKLNESTPEDRRFPISVLKNRLLNIGLREFLEISAYRDAQGRDFQGRALEVYGFPFKFVSQLDEAILATTQFLRRFSDEEGSSLNLYALHRLSKGEEKSLAFWQTPKAKLYIELQNIILLLNGVGSRVSTISRILTFSKVEDLAFLTQPAINVLSEQLAAGININFLFLDTFENKENQHIGQISNSVILHFVPPPNKPQPNVSASPPDNGQQFDFFAVRGLLEEEKAHDLPYQDRCIAKWYVDMASAVGQDELLGNFVALFQQAKPITAKPTGICGFPGGGAVFNRATLMMYQAFNRGNTHIKGEDFRRRINETVITRDLIRLERTMAAFDDSGIDEIKAVDATSVKGTLRIHESNPSYRQWLRRSLNHVLVDPGKRKSLARIYILEDRKSVDSKNMEFKTFGREMQYYLDYLNYEMSEMTQIISENGATVQTKPTINDTLVAKCNSFKDRIRVYVTTSSILYNFAPRMYGLDPVIIWEILNSPYSPDSSVSVDSVRNMLPKLDYLFTDGPQAMIYNFLNQLGDPGELTFDADLYRASFVIPTEKQLLFDFLYSDDTFRPEDPLDPDAAKAMEKLRGEQLQSRTQFLLSSFTEYYETYHRILEKQLPKKIHTALKNKIDLVGALTDQRTLLKTRRYIERPLYKYFAPRFAYLYELLKYQSVEVDFFPSVPERLPGSRLAAREIKETYPFNLCSGSKPSETPRRTPSDQLYTLIEAKIAERLKVKGSVPQFIENTRISREPVSNRPTTSLK